MESSLSSGLVSVIVQAGAVGLSAASLWIIYKLVTNHDAHLLEALNRNTDAWLRNTEALAKLSDKLDKS